MSLRVWLYNHLILGDSARISEGFYREILRFDASRATRAQEELLRHAAAHVPFYRDQGLAGAELSQYPVIHKNEVRANFDRLIADDADRASLHTAHTSGSTGSPLTVVQDATMHEWTRATELYFLRNMLGLDPVEAPSVVFWASTPSIWGQRRNLRKKLSLWLSQTSLLGASRFTAAEMRNAVDTINKRKPHLIKSYTSPLYEVARFIRLNKIRIHQPKVICTVAETLHPHMREQIEEVFGCPIRDFYGAREMGPIAGQCEHGRMHLFMFHTHTEMLNGADCQALPGTEARAILTTLHNRVMPLIRYDIQDAVVPATGECPCGNKLPSLERISGRLVDFFLAPDGSLVWGGYFNRTMASQDWIEDYQVEQMTPEELVIRFVSRTPPEQARIHDIEKKIRLVMGKHCQIEWQRLDTMPPMPKGKRLYTVSRVWTR